MQNCLSKVPGIFINAWGIWSTLILRCYNTLRPEIQAFMTNMMVPVLTEVNLRPQQLTSLLRVCALIVREPEVLATLYVSMDCSLDEDNCIASFLAALTQVLCKKQPNLQDLSYKHAVLANIQQSFTAIRESIQSNPELVTQDHAIYVEKARKDLLEQGIDVFNRSPTKGIELLIDKQLIENSSIEVAKFLHRERRLSRSAIGEFLSSTSELCRVILHWP